MSTDVAVYQGEAQGFTVEQQSLLNERLQVEHIKERKGTGGKMLKYVSGDYAIATANRIFGFGKWGYRVLSKSREQVGEEEFYTADIELYVIGCPFPVPGEGVGTVKRAQGAAYATVEQHEKARKEAVTDALKRALRHYGDQFGLSLYNEDNYVEDDNGNPVQVKNVGKPQPAAKPAPRVVDAAPAQPTSTINAPTPFRLSKMFQSINQSMDTAQKLTFKVIKPADNLTPEECATLYQVFLNWKKTLEEKAAQTA